MQRESSGKVTDKMLGGIFILLGLMTCIFANRMVSVFHYIVGGVILITGSVRLFCYFHSHAYEDPANNHFIVGMVDIVIGILIVAVPGRSMIFICLVWGVWSVVKAILTMNRLIQQRLQGYHVTVKVIIAMIELVLGITLMLELTNAIGHHILLLGLTFIVGGIKQWGTGYKRLPENPRK